MWRASLVVLTACGRLGFESLVDDGSGPDASPGAADASAVVPAGLRLWFEFNPGAERRDTISGQLAACTSCPTATTGPRGTAAAFAASACLTFADAPVFAAQELTISLWIRSLQSESGTAFGKAFDATSTNKNSWEIWMASAQNAQFNTDGTGTSAYMFVEFPQPGAWQHWAGTFGPDGKRSYVNGLLNDAVAGPPNLIAYDDEPVRIGCDRDLGAVAQFFVGELDDVRFYDRVLTSAEIALLAAP